jgi:hypothetical protein
MVEMFLLSLKTARIPCGYFPVALYTGESQTSTAGNPWELSLTPPETADWLIERIPAIPRSLPPSP